MEAVIARPGHRRDALLSGWRYRGFAGACTGASKGTSRCSTRMSATGRLSTPDHPDALDRVWSALTCPTSGDVLLSAAPGREFADLGGQAARRRWLARVAARGRLAWGADRVRRGHPPRARAVGDPRCRRARVERTSRVDPAEPLSATRLVLERACRTLLILGAGTLAQWPDVSRSHGCITRARARRGRRPALRGMPRHQALPRGR